MSSSAFGLIENTPPPALRRYGDTVIALALATLVCRLLEPILSDSAALSIYLIPVAFAAWYGGRGPALMALVVGGLLADYLFAEPRGALHLLDAKIELEFALHLAVGVLIIQVMEQLRRSREQALASEARLRMAAQAGAFGTFDVDFATGQTFWSEEALAIFGLPPDLKVGLDANKVPQAVHPEDQEIARGALEAALDPAGPGVLEAEHRIVRPDGTQRWIRTRGKALFSGRGAARKAVRVIGAFHDVTERKIAKANLERHAHALQERMKELECLYSFARITGQGGLSADALAKVLQSLVSAYQYPEICCAKIDLEGSVYQTQNYRESPWHQRSSISTGARDIGHIEVGYTEQRANADEGPFLKEERDLIDAVAVLLAGSFHHWLDRAALVESETRFCHLVEAMPEILYQGDHAPFTFSFVSPHVQRVLGLGLAECLNEPERWIQQLHDEDRERVLWEAAAARLRIDIEFLTLEYRLLHKDGKTVHWFRDSARLERDADGKVISFVGVLSDITERKRLEQELQEADQRKDAFLATLAHELRNPLAPIRNAFALIRRGGERRELVDQALEMGERQMGHLVRIVDELLDIARISIGKITLNLEQVSLRTIIDHAVELSRPQIESGKHRLTIELPESEVMLRVDSLRLTQVFSNLLNNSAKYTDSGGSIRLTARTDPSEQALVVEIEDNGIGIPPQVMPHVFDLFLQGAQSRHHIWQGLGVGLPLAKRLVELHGGVLAVASAGEGTGSTFSVRLPLPWASSPAITHADQIVEDTGVATRPLRILVIDDDKDVADSTAMVLREEGHEVRVAYDGAAGIEAAVEYLPEVIILDIGLPGLNGHECARRLRARPQLRDTWLVALTGWGKEQDRRRSEEAGIDHHLVKPVDSAALYTLMRACATAPRGAGDCDPVQG